MNRVGHYTLSLLGFIAGAAVASASDVGNLRLPNFALASPDLHLEISLWSANPPQRSFSLLPDTAIFYDVPFEDAGMSQGMDFRELPSGAGHPARIHGNFDSPGPGYRQQRGGLP